MPAKKIICATCRRDARKVNSEWSECSHMECPYRRNKPVFDHHVSQQYAGGFVEAPSEQATGCIKADPTTKD